MSTISERVAQGVAWLDENAPDWLSRIDLAELQLGSCCDCVIGQTFGCYASDHPLDYDKAAGLGFNTARYGGAGSEDLAHLNEEWRRVITERRAAA